MRRNALTLAVTLCAAASLAAAAGAPSTARPASSQAARAAQVSQVSQAAQRLRPPVLVDCFWHPRVRPAHFILACGDGNSRLAALRWYRWGPGTARGQGVNWVNDCKPYCAAGRFHAYPVIVRLDRPEPWKKRPHLRHYTRMTLVYTGSRPDSFPRTVTYPLWN